MRVLALAILVVAVTTALLVWGCFRLCRDAERMERDPRLLRRRLLWWGFFYIASSAVTILKVLTGSLPPMALIGLPIAAGFVWTSIKAARAIKIPPS